MSSTRIHPIWFAFLAAGAFVVACVDLALPNKYPSEDVLSDGGGGGGGTGGEGDDGGDGGGTVGGRADGGADGGGPATYTVVIKNLAFNPPQVTKVFVLP